MALRREAVPFFELGQVGDLSYWRARYDPKRSVSARTSHTNERHRRSSGMAPPTMMKGESKRMASIDWSQCPAVESIPGKVSGAWLFRGTRVPVAAIFENLKTSSMEEVLENFHVTREQIQTVLDFAAKSTQPLETSRVG